MGPTCIILGAFAAAVLGLAGASRAAPEAKATSPVPFVACRSDGQLGPQAAPAAPKVTPRAPTAVARQLAFYAAGDDVALGVLAPRGWNCFGLYGSNGSTLYVTPEPHDGSDLLKPGAPGLSGAAIQLSVSNGGTSGRFEVAAIAARIFPTQADYVRQVIANQLDVDKTFDGVREFPKGPYPSDRMVRLRPLLVEFETPAQKDGLGTHSRLLKTAQPIVGFAKMEKDGDNSLTMFTMRLPPSLRDLSPTILKTAERQQGRGRRKGRARLQLVSTPVRDVAGSAR